jgi:hypothetical protein
VIAVREQVSAESLAGTGAAGGAAATAAITAAAVVGGDVKVINEAMAVGLDEKATAGGGEREYSAAVAAAGGEEVGRYAVGTVVITKDERGSVMEEGGCGGVQALAGENESGSARQQGGGSRKRAAAQQRLSAGTSARQDRRWEKKV